MLRCYLTLLLPLLLLRAAGAVEPRFEEGVGRIFSTRCVTCHNGKNAEGALSLATGPEALAGGDSGEAIVPGDAAASLLVEYISGPKPEMPKEDDPLSAEEIATISAWIEAGARWPAGLNLEPRDGWWSRQPLVRPAVPEPSPGAPKLHTPIDHFLAAKLHTEGLAFSPEADRRTLIRRLYFDLLGLPPAPEEVERFENDSQPAAYERLVDRLLEDPAYGERWARHWLDAVAYADTHGFDKDKIRPNAWPYRDYVIRSFNEDKPYARFVSEQLAGDVLYPESPEAVIALGFIAAGPFDFVGQIEVREGTLEKQRVRNIDRDGMVASTMNTFVSTTVECARCHNHKFDPIPQRDYYAMQAVFAAVDRAEREVDADSTTARRRLELAQRRAALEGELAAMETEQRERAGEPLVEVERRLAALGPAAGEHRPEFGYHSRIEAAENVVKWVQIDLAASREIATIEYVGCHDDFNNIGAGFGFPRRYKIELSNDSEFEREVTLVLDRTTEDVANPGVEPQRIEFKPIAARYLRITAVKLAPRRNDFIFALGEVRAFSPDGKNLAAGAEVTALDSIEAAPRWGKRNLVDDYHYGQEDSAKAELRTRLTAERDSLLAAARNGEFAARFTRAIAERDRVVRELGELPPLTRVYAAATEFEPQGNFRPTNGKPRPIYLLKRGSEAAPDREIGPLAPGALSALPQLAHHFNLADSQVEGAARAALARWIVDPQNPLTWRSIVNRVWQHHFGRGIVDSPNDFGRMGERPTHPELLDWLAVEFRDSGGSFKRLHKLIVTSTAYRQVSASRDDFAEIDRGNRYLWRANRRKLEAEAVRDSVLAVAGKLNRTMGGPAFRAFAFTDDHSPRYEYTKHDVDDPASHRRSVYRFTVRSVPDPLMETLDCADPSMNVPKRIETLTPLQALAMLNNPFMVRMAEHFAARVETQGESTNEQVAAAFRLALAREPRPEELRELVAIAEEHGTANACRLLFNLNEFLFID